MYEKALGAFSILALLITSSIGVLDSQSDVASAEEQAINKAQVKVVKVNDAQFKVVPNQYAEGKVENGKATIVNKKTGGSESLPLEVKTKNNEKANVTYKVLDGNIIEDVKLAKSDEIVSYKTNWKKCALGTGGAVLGGTGGGIATGAGYGAIGATPVSVGVGSAIEGVIGGVSSGMVGAASSCFD